MASAVLFEPVPAITGTLPPAPSTQISTTRLCSAGERVGDSPVVPTGTRPFVPSLICQATNFRKADSSTFPSFMGVIKAGNEPLNCTTNLVVKILETFSGIRLGAPQLDCHAP